MKATPKKATFLPILSATTALAMAPMAQGFMQDTWPQDPASGCAAGVWLGGAVSCPDHLATPWIVAGSSKANYAHLCNYGPAQASPPVSVKFPGYEVEFLGCLRLWYNNWKVPPGNHSLFLPWKEADIGSLLDKLDRTDNANWCIEAPAQWVQGEVEFSYATDKPLWTQKNVCVGKPCEGYDGECDADDKEIIEGSIYKGGRWSKPRWLTLFTETPHGKQGGQCESAFLNYWTTRHIDDDKDSIGWLRGMHNHWTLNDVTDQPCPSLNTVRHDQIALSRPETDVTQTDIWEGHVSCYDRGGHTYMILRSQCEVSDH